MKKRLTHVSPLRCGIVLGILYAIISLVFLPLFLLVAVFGKGGLGQSIASWVLILLLPVLYGVLGFIFGVIAAAMYNLIAKWTGGLEFEVTDVPPTA